MNRAPATWQGAVFAAIFGMLSACSGGGGGAPEGGAGPGGPPPVTVAPVAQRTVQDSEEFVARLEATQSVTLRARVSGTLEQVHFKEGQRVARGALLFTLDPRPFAAEVTRAQAALATTRTQAELARADLARAEKLVSMQAVSAQEIDQLRAAQRNADSAVASAQAALQTAQLNLGYTRITAPFAGRMSRAEVTAGNLVDAGQSVLSTLVSTDQVYAYFDASEATYLRLRGNADAKADAPAVPVAMGLSDETGHPHPGKLDFVDNRLNPATGSIRARAVFANTSGRFTPGLSARLKIGSGVPYTAAVVPERAISTDQTRKTVLVVGANNIVMPREVQLGTLVDGQRVVTGVKPGELVIVDGLQRAFPGAPVTPQQAPAASAPAAPAAAAPAPASGASR